MAEVVLADGRPSAAARDVYRHVKHHRRVHRGDVGEPHRHVRLQQALGDQGALPVGKVHHLHRQSWQPLDDGLLGVPLEQQALNHEALLPVCRHGISITQNVVHAVALVPPIVLSQLDVVADAADAERVRVCKLRSLDGIAIADILDAQHELIPLMLALYLAGRVAEVVHAVGAPEDVMAGGNDQLGELRLLGVQGDLIPQPAGQGVGHAQRVVDEQAQHLLLVEGDWVEHARAQPDSGHRHYGPLGIVLPGLGLPVLVALQGLLHALRHRHACEPVEDPAGKAVDALDGLGDTGVQSAGAAGREDAAAHVGLKENPQR
mmetsp:Transcript_105922/g.326896  ORF Transcript_105922/g.326896 Transcript_105922/m.326896 type:complete len:319 (+) Transcript_105922:1388-2344(+)